MHSLRLLDHAALPTQLHRQSHQPDTSSEYVRPPPPTLHVRPPAPCASGFRVWGSGPPGLLPVPLGHLPGPQCLIPGPLGLLTGPPGHLPGPLGLLTFEHSPWWHRSWQMCTLHGSSLPHVSPQVGALSSQLKPLQVDRTRRR
jgi:hypothetical protein